MIGFSNFSFVQIKISSGFYLQALKNVCTKFRIYKGVTRRKFNSATLAGYINRIKKAVSKVVIANEVKQS